MDAVLLPSADALDEVATALDTPVERYGSVGDALALLRGGGVACVVVDVEAVSHDTTGVVGRFQREGDAAVALAAAPEAAGALLSTDADAVVDRTAPAAAARRLTSLVTDHAIDRAERRGDGARALVREAAEAVRKDDESDGLEKVADVVVNALGGSDPYPSAWLGTHDPGRAVVEPVAAAGVPLAHLRSLPVRSEAESGDAEATLRAVREDGGTAVLVGSDHGEAADADDGSSDLLAVRVPTDPVAVLHLVTDRPEGPADDERAALCDLAETVATVVDGDGTTDGGADRIRLLADALAHELGNQLSAASLQLDLAEEHGDAEHFEHVARALDRLEGLVTETRALARAEPEREWTDLETVATEAWDAVAAEDASLEVEPGTLEADPDLLRLALVNLLRNAVEHGTDGPEDDLRVEVGPAGDSGLYVADDGVGIPSDDRATVLEWGHSGGDGSGVGLGLVRLFAERHGWMVEVTESESGGAKVVLTPG
jgi:signal transduction histidine kinase